MSNYLNSCKQSNPLDHLAALLPTRNAVKMTWNGTLTATCRVWVERYQQRQRLANLSLRMLKDIGITPEEAVKEAQKPFWVK